MKPTFLLSCLVLAPSASSALTEPPKFRVLIVDGQNNHRWQETTPYMKRVLEETNRFDVEVATTPEGSDLSAFQPQFDRYDAVLLNYNGHPWTEAAHAAMEKAVAGGKGLVIVHAANNAFVGRKEYSRLLGLGWRPKDAGVGLKIDEEGKVESVPAGTGPDVGHGERHAFVVSTRGTHPITNGLPPKWIHAKDELYHGLRGPAEGMTILATAFSDPARGGTGAHEPVVWTVDYHKGRVFHIVLGHDVSAMECVGFITLLQRGTEWAAIGHVSIPIPQDFPTESAVKTRSNYVDQLKKYWPVMLVLPLAVLLFWGWARRRWARTATSSLNDAK